MNVHTAVRLTPILPVVGVLVAVTGLWKMPEDDKTVRVAASEGHQTVLLDIAVRPPANRFDWEAETTGLMAALLEGGLSSMYGVTARIDRTPVAAGLDVATAPERWSATLAVEGEPDALQTELTLCDPEQVCTPYVATGSQDAPEVMARKLVEEVGIRLGRDTELATAWTRSQSDDHYAELVAGRGAAVWYGWVDPAPPQDQGNVLRDPIARAPWLDPTMPIAQWMAARRFLEQGDPLSAEMSLRRGAEHFPGSLLDVAHATILMQNGSPEEAAEKFRSLGSTFASDPRMEFNEIEALLVSGNPNEATVRLDALPERAQDAPRALQLRTMIERAEGKVPNPDGLLARWQETDPYDPEPVRLRIDALVQQGRFPEALELTTELATRGSEAEARSLELALAAEVEQWPRAIAAAEQIDPDLAAAIRDLSGQAEDAGGESHQMLGATVLLERASRLLDEGDTDGALALVHRVLRSDPDNVDALALQVETMRRTGNEQALLRARCALHDLHPGAVGDPASAETISLSFRCSQR